MVPRPLTRRSLLRSATAMGVAAALPACVTARSVPFHATLSTTEAAINGVPAFPTLTAALAAAPPGDAPYRIFIPAGTWREHNRVTRANVHLGGATRATSRLVFNDRANEQRPPDVPGSTLDVRAPGFSAAHLTIDNDFDYPNYPLAEVPYDRTGASGAQARAVYLEPGADRSTFVDVAMNGWQDTLFVDAGRSLFSGCTVSGCTDFIYGAGVVVFDRCEIRSRTRPGKDFHGFVVAPSTHVDQPVGIVFLDCRLTKDQDMPPHTVALGRPWRRTKAFPDGKRYGNPDCVPHAAFVRCWLDDHIVPEGWYPMHFNDANGVRVMFQPEDARLFEYESRGPGRGVGSARRRQLSAAQASELTPARIFGDWIPEPGA